MRSGTILLLSVLMAAACRTSDSEPSVIQTAAVQENKDAAGRRRALLEAADQMIELDRETPADRLPPLKRGRARRLRTPLPDVSALRAAFGRPDSVRSVQDGSSRQTMEWTNPTGRGFLLFAQLGADGLLEGLTIYEDMRRWESVFKTGDLWFTSDPVP